MFRKGNAANDAATRRSIRRGPDRDEEALEWHLRFSSGDADDADRAAFARWRAHAGNDRLYAELEDIWDGLGIVLAPAGSVAPFPRRLMLVRKRANWFAMAASIVAMLTVGYQYAHVWRHDVVAQGTERAFAALPDGSRVVLNTGAAIDVAFTGEKRHIRLVRGEAFFDVRHDPAHPFTVDGGIGDVRVLGTAFSVTRDDAGGRVVVQRGKVRVQAAGKTVDVAPDRAVRFVSTGPGAVQAVNASSALGWTRGRIYLRNMRLADVLTSLDRYHAGMLILRDNRLADRRISGIVRIDRVDEWLDGLARAQHIRLRQLPWITIVG